MGVLIVIGTTVVVGTIIHRLYARFATPPMAVPALAAPAVPVAAVASAAAGLLAGEHIEGMAAAGPDVAIWVTGPQGERVLLLDPVSGQTRVALRSGP